MLHLLLISLILYTYSTIPAANKTTIAPTYPLTATTIGTIANRQFIITSKDIDGNIISTGGNIYIAELYTSSPYCVPSIITPNCNVLCSPYNLPNTASSNCLSTNRPTNTSVPFWSVATVTDNSDGTYLVTSYPEVKGLYDISVYIATQGGLYGSYYDNIWFLNNPTFNRIDSQINFQWGTGIITSYGSTYVGIRWSGKVRADYSELFTFYVNVDDGARLWIDNTLVIDTWNSCCNETFGNALLNKNTLHSIKIEYKQLKGISYAELRWSSFTVPKQIIPQQNLFYLTHILNSPFLNVTVDAGDPPASNSSHITGTGLNGGIVGSTGTFTLKTIDIFNNSLDFSSSNAVFTYTISGPDASPSKALTYNANGTYSGTYNITKTGVYTLSVKIDGNHVIGSPSYFSMTPSTTVINNTICYGSGIGGTGTSSISTGFYIQAVDYLRNNVTSSYELIQLVFNGPGSVPYTVDYTTTPGLYYVVYTPQVSGTYTFTVSMNGSVIPTSPYDLVVSAGAIYAPHCTITSNTAASTNNTAGATSGITLQLRDFYNNTVTSGSPAVSFSMIGIAGPALVGGYPTPASPSPSTITASVSEFSSGACIFTFTPLVAGTYTMRIIVSGLDVYGSPSTTSVIPNAISTATTTAGGLGVSPSAYQMVGVQSKFSVSALDAYNNVPTTIQVNNTLTMSGVLTCGSIVTSMDSSLYMGSGTFQFTYTPTIANPSCSLAVKWNGNHIYGSPFAIYVLPGHPSATNSTITGSNLALITAGVMGTFTLQAVDAYGNNLIVGDSPFNFNISFTNSTQASLTGTSASTLLMSFSSNGNGVYIGTYTFFITGTYLLNIWLAAINGLMANYYTTTDYTNLFSSVKVATVNFDWGVNSPLIGTAYPADYFSISFVGRIMPPSSATYRLYIAVAANSGIRLLINGKFVINQATPLAKSNSRSSESYGDINLAGGIMYDIMILYDTASGVANIALSWSSPNIVKQIVPSTYLYSHELVGHQSYLLTVIPDSTAAATTVITSLPSFTAGTASTFTIQAYDQYKNKRANSTSSDLSLFSVTLSGSPSSTATISVLSNGLFNVTIVPNSIGNHILTATYNSVRISDSPVTVSVSNGAAYGPNCVLAILPLSSNQLPTSLSNPSLNASTAGLYTRFMLTSYDVRGNLRSVGGDNVEFSATGTVNGVVTSITAVVSDLNNGSYVFNYTAAKSGTYTVTILMNGAAVSGTPFTLTLSPSIISPVYSYVSGIESTVASAGSSYFTFSAYDVLQNAHTSGGARLVARLTNNYDTTLRATVIDQNNGNYTVRFNITTAGNYSLHLYVVSGYQNNLNGLLGNYYNNRWLQGTPVITRVDRTINLNWGTDLITPTATSYVSIRWTGFIRPSYAANYTIFLNAADGGRLYIENILVVDTWKAASAGESYGYYTFSEADLLYSIVIEYRHTTGSAYVSLSWSSGLLTKEIVPYANLYSAATELSTSPYSVYAT